jgi:subtilisin family serine protease
MESEESAKQTQPGYRKEPPKREPAPLRFWTQGEVVVVGQREDVNQAAKRVAEEMQIALKPRLESNPQSNPAQTTIWDLILLLVRLFLQYILLLFSGTKRGRHQYRAGATKPQAKKRDGNPGPGSRTAGTQNLGALADSSVRVTATYKILPREQTASVPSVPEVVAMFKELSDGRVAANPNYKTGRAVFEFSGDPDSSEGGSLTDAEGAEIDADEAEMYFYNQWALHARKEGRVGISLFESKLEAEDLSSEEKLAEKRSVTAEGEGVTVALFDASPFDRDSRWRNVGIDPTLPWDRYRKITSLKHMPVPGIPDARDHGLFSASLVQAVAPKSDIRLLRVLNDSNRGKLDILNDELSGFIAQRELENENEERPLANTVINLSLGVHVGSQDSDDDSDEPVETLHMILRDAYGKGAVIVAAAGNDSAGVIDPAHASQIPASYGFVIGVGASNCEGGHACFSNIGDVYAPGGDNIAACDPSTTDCTVENEFKNCIIGYAHHIAPDSHFASWKGTSFAAPLVSGLAALLLGAGYEQNEVRNRIVNTAMTEAVANAVPVINIRESFNSLP